MQTDCDLHLHGYFSGGVSKNMMIQNLGSQAKLKGLHLMATGDILNKDWLQQAKSCLFEENGCFLEKESRTAFVLQTEVNDSDRVHHIVFLPDFNAVDKLRASLEKFGKLDGLGYGRPTLKADAEAIAEKVKEAGGVMGPAHAFTPYFSVYSHFNSVEECYKSMAGEVDFIELGLSADSYFADLMEENHKYHFLCCSDSHSPWPHRIGREFTRIEMKKPCFEGLKKALKEKKPGVFLLNAGLDPREGKYHCTACTQCFQKYSMEDSAKMKWKCPRCGSRIKKGVRDRIMELAKFKEEIHPEFRPPYMHSIPLAEIISIAIEVENPQSPKVQALWLKFVQSFGSEIKVLVDAPVVELAEIDEKIALKVEAFRKGFVHYIGGGGGNYGKPIICDSMEDFERKRIELKDCLDCNTSFKGQKTLGEY
ncbi:MAG: TIGR00375 family protein [Candidatus Diapherotrites archaeon]|nr:TIGR00375 family protein [Candidatus Diapherotrites archaeon]